MAATKLHIRKQVDRLVSLPGQQTEAFGVEPQTVRDDLGRALERFANSDEEATALVDWLIFERDPAQRNFRPVPGQIGDAASALAERRQGSQLPAGCAECGGTGRLHTFRRIFDVVAQREVEIDGQRACVCQRGQYLAAKDAERAKGAA